MKPRIKKFGHLWRCVGWCGPHNALGFGKTPKEAYRGWLNNLLRGIS